MDVRCGRCSTEYELDDARVALGGTTVKCSTCGHVFKVLPSGQTVSKDPEPRRASTETPTMGSYPAAAPPSEKSDRHERPAPAPNPTPSVPAGEWMVKKTDGQTFRFRELTTLQKWIVERKVGRDDEISRTGKSWKKLGEIAELTSFFQVVEAAEAAQKAVTQSQMPAIQLTASQTGTFQAIPIPQPAPLPQPTEQVPSPTAPPITLAPQPARQPPANTSNDVDVGELDDDDPVLAWQKRRKTMMAAGVGVGLVALVVVVIVLATRAAPVPELDPAMKTLAQDALRSDVDERRDAALVALAAHKTVPVAQAWQARLQAAQVQALLDENRLKEQLGALDTAAAALIPSTTSGERLLAEATASVVALRARDPVPPEADLAAAAIDLANGDKQSLSTDVALAQEHAKHLADGPDRAAVDTEARLLLTLAEASRVDDVGDAKDSLQKLERFNDGRARAAATMVAVSLAVLSKPKDAPLGKDVADAALAVVARIADGDPRKATAQKILAALQVAPPAPTPTPTTTPPTTTPTTPTTPTTTPTTPPPPTPTTPTTTPPVENESYDVVMQKAEKALVSDKSAVAYELLKRAVVLRPDVARPWLKLGWAAMDTSRQGEAQRAFSKALNIDSGLSEAQFGLAESLRFSGKKDEAIAAYKAYLSMDPAGKEAGIAKNALKQLE